jgi:hypothetical protein
LSARTQADDDRAAAKAAAASPAGAEPAPAAKPAAKMTMMERQKAWMQAKAAALEVAKAEKEKELSDSLKFKPDTESSRRTFKTTPAAAVKPEQPRPTLSQPKPVALAVPATTTASKWAAAKAKVVKAKKPKTAKAKSDKPAPVGAERLAELLAEDKAATAAANPAAGNESEGEEDAEEEALVEAVEESPPAPFVPGSFWWRVEDGRGHFRVNDGSLFQMWTIYRKKDKSRDVDGTKRCSHFY